MNVAEVGNWFGNKEHIDKIIAMKRIKQVIWTQWRRQWEKMRWKDKRLVLTVTKVGGCVSEHWVEQHEILKADRRLVLSST